jgi:hypothetical protein
MKKIITLVLAFVVTSCVAQTDTTEVDYIQILQIDTTGGYFPYEEFYILLKHRYSALGNINSLTTSQQYLAEAWILGSVCICFEACPMRYICYTPYEIEEKLKNTIQQK